MKRRMVFIIVALFSCSQIFSDNIDDYPFDELDVYAPMLESYVALSSSCATASNALNLFADPTGIALQNKLQGNLYLFTYNPNLRSVLDLPAFLIHEYCLPGNWQINAWLFYNETPKVYYTDEGTNLPSYWNIQDANFIQNLDDLDIGIDLPTVQEISDFFKIQERRGGLMMGAAHLKGRYNLEFKTPLYYFERNFFVTPQEQEIIEMIFGPSNPEHQKFFVCDRFGFGDTRLTGGYLAIDKDWIQVNVGAEATIPTQFTIKKPLIGSFYPKNSNSPPFNLLEIFTLGFCDGDLQQVQDIAIDFFISVYQKLAANLLEPGLGNNGHLGLMVFAEQFLEINDRVSVTARSALEYMCPAWEKRFYITKKFPQLFVDLAPYTDLTDPAEATFKLNFLNQQLIDTFIPQVYRTMVYPGFIFKFTTGITGRINEEWQVGGGYDLWLQAREKLETIKATPLEISNIRTDIAHKPGAYQSKVFVSTNYEQGGGRFDWCLTFYGDYTFLSSGIGQDFTLSLRFAAEI